MQHKYSGTFKLSVYYLVYVKTTTVVTNNADIKKANIVQKKIRKILPFCVVYLIDTRWLAVQIGT